MTVEAAFREILIQDVQISSTFGNRIYAMFLPENGLDELPVLVYIRTGTERTPTVSLDSKRTIATFEVYVIHSKYATMAVSSLDVINALHEKSGEYHGTNIQMITNIDERDDFDTSINEYVRLHTYQVEYIDG